MDLIDSHIRWMCICLCTLYTALAHTIAVVVIYCYSRVLRALHTPNMKYILYKYMWIQFVFKYSNWINVSILLLCSVKIDRPYSLKSRPSSRSSSSSSRTLCYIANSNLEFHNERICVYTKLKQSKYAAQIPKKQTSNEIVCVCVCVNRHTKLELNATIVAIHFGKTMHFLKNVWWNGIVLHSN